MMRPFLQFYETVNISLIILITDCAQGNSLRIIDHDDITVVLLRKRAFLHSQSVFAQLLLLQIRTCNQLYISRIDWSRNIDGKINGILCMKKRGETKWGLNSFYADNLKAAERLLLAALAVNIELEERSRGTGYEGPFGRCGSPDGPDDTTVSISIPSLNITGGV